MSESRTLPGGTVELTFHDDCAEIVLNRPDRMNAMDAAMVGDLRLALDEVQGQGARALVIRGSGRAFCSGRDLSGADPANEDGGAILCELFNPLMLGLAELPVPTFAAVHGACLGTGMGLAMACDVVYAADDARLGSPFSRIGAVVDSGVHLAWTRRIGPGRTLELIYTGRMLSGREAAEWGLVERSMAGSDLVRRTLEAARAVAAGPTLALVESKRLVGAAAAGDVDLAGVLEAEAQAQTRASRTADYREGIGAFIAKRAPLFTGR